jgi:FKBP-type peptidyl-prolyl cis-trans isomerase FkpA
MPSVRLIVLLPTLLFAACGGDGASSSTSTATPAAAPAAAPPAVADVAALGIQDPVAGTGAEARPGMMVSVHYTGWLFDPSAADKRGKKFDSSKDRGQPFEFQLGQRDVIAGWDEGVKGMKVGGTRILTIPSAMGYGARGAGGDIPPNAALLFEVELLGVK